MVRDLVGYADDPPKFQWPNGGRLALTVIVNYEEGAEPTPLDGDAQVSGLNEIPHPLPPPGERDEVQESVYEYGSRTAIWRLLHLFDEHRISATVFLSALALERNPKVAAAFTQRSWDFVGHGYKWVAPTELTAEARRSELRRTITSIRATTGRTIDGWFDRAPWSRDTMRRISVEEGLFFDNASFSDDIPYFEEVAGRPMLIVPYSIDNNDLRFWTGRSFGGRDFGDYLIDGFDVLHRESARAPRMMSVGLHARMVGRPGRIAGLERFLEHVGRHEDVWVTTRTELATFWAEQFAPKDLWNWPRPRR